MVTNSEIRRRKKIGSGVSEDFLFHPKKKKEEKTNYQRQKSNDNITSNKFGRYFFSPNLIFDSMKSTDLSGILNIKKNNISFY